MEKYIFEEQLGILASRYEETGNNDILSQIAAFFQSYLAFNQDDEDCLITYALFLHEKMHDEQTAIDLLLDLLINRKSKNSKALLVCLEMCSISRPCEEKIIQLVSTVETYDKSILSMIEYVQTYPMFCGPEEVEKEVEHLIRSVQLCGNQVKNLSSLAGYYMGRGDFYKAKELLKRAMRNIRLIDYNNKYAKDLIWFTTADDYINEFITGINPSPFIFESIDKQYAACLQELQKEKEHRSIQY
jgi:tetratricopeptide (TPR) repeat protein